MAYVNRPGALLMSVGMFVGTVASCYQAYGKRASADSCHVPIDTRRKIHNNMVVDILGTLFLALSDPTRRGIIERLSRGPATVNELTEPFAVSQQMISKHIAYLIRANIVVKTKRGRESVCTLKPEAIKVVSDWALEYRRFWEESFDKLDAVLAEMKRTEASDD